jgi:hypothetical protein
MNINTYEELKKLYLRTPERSLQNDLAYFIATGYVFSGPGYLLIGRRVYDGWFVHVAIGSGSLKKFLQCMPFYLPFIGWAREQRGRKTKWHRTEVLAKKLGVTL